MDNAVRYHFADFTTDNFRRLVRLAKANYLFRRFTDFDPAERFVLWRHDVDFSVHRAAKMARIEAEEGVTATYFLHLHSEFYNLLEFEVKRLVKELVSFGHALGLHFDTHYYGVEHPEQLEQLLDREKCILEESFEAEIRVFSFHITSPAIVQFDNPKYSGLINAYADYFRTEVPYCSDSNGYWRHRRLEDVLQKAADPRLQVLTHPELWQETVMSPKERVHRCIAGRAEKTRRWYDDTLRMYGRENVDW
jgi:hypothetical protein